MAMAHLARAGHRAIAVLGGGTAMVGDPSGKSEMRQIISAETIAENRAGIEPQVRQIIGADALVVDNGDWLLPLNYIAFLRDIGRHFSVNRMLAAEATPSGIRSLAADRSVTRLGESAFRSGRISEDAIRFLCEQLARMREVYVKLEVLGVRAVATAAVRDASNQHEVLERASDAAGTPVEIISGQGFVFDGTFHQSYLVSYTRKEDCPAHDANLPVEILSWEVGSTRAGDLLERDGSVCDFLGHLILLCPANEIRLLQKGACSKSNPRKPSPCG